MRYKEEKVRNYSKSEFRDAIRYEEILKQEIDINLYDCKSAIFNRNFMLYGILASFALFYLHFIITNRKMKKVRDYFWLGFIGAAGTCIGSMIYYRKF